MSSFIARSLFIALHAIFAMPLRALPLHALQGTAPELQLVEVRSELYLVSTKLHSKAVAHSRVVPAHGFATRVAAPAPPAAHFSSCWPRPDASLLEAWDFWLSDFNWKGAFPRTLGARTRGGTAHEAGRSVVVVVVPREELDDKDGILAPGAAFRAKEATDL